MKKLIISLLLLISVSSCRFDFDYDELWGEHLKREYSQSFTETFGTYGILNIDNSHNWGFTDFPEDTILFDTRSVNPNSNEWYVIPEGITSNERTYVENWFATHKNPPTLSVNWSDYFVQQVSGINRQMNKLIVSVDGKTKYDHVYNLNGANGSIKLMQNSVSNYFGYHYSKDGKNHFKFTIQYLRDAFYVGFDAIATGSNANQKEDPDGYYNDWIIKITPCLPKDGVGKRIMVEDLGNIGDFDFNDVVFDCFIKYNQHNANKTIGIVILRAAGGTMPLYIDGNEVHELFGVDVTHITNTDNKYEKIPVIFRLKNVRYSNPKEIPIFVKNTKEDISYYISADQGEAPGKICVPITVEWADECQNIRDKYPKFTLWIQDKTINFWE